MSPTSRPGTLQVAALGVLLAGSAVCWALSQQPQPSGGVDTRQLREMAERLTTPAAADTPLTVPAASGKSLSTLLPASAVRPPKPPAVTRMTVPAPARGTVPTLPSAQPQGAPASALAPVPAPSDPLETLALVGITQRAGADQAWIMDLERRSQEQVSVGERAFGFTVKGMDAESVTLERDGQSYTLRMGDKPLQLAALSPSGTDPGGDFQGVEGSGGPGGMTGPGGMRGMAGPGGMNGRGGMGSMTMGGPGTMRGMGGQGGFAGRGGQGGEAMASSSGSRGGDSFSGGPMIFGGPGMNGGGMNGGGMNGGMGGRSGGMGSAGSTGSRGGAGSSGFSSGGSTGAGGNTGTGFSSTGSTSNPQTARRNGSRYTGDGQTAPAVEERVNPQTQRRTGGTANGTASFGTGESLQNVFGPSSQGGGTARR